MEISRTCKVGDRVSNVEIEQTGDIVDIRWIEDGYTEVTIRWEDGTESSYPIKESELVPWE